MLSPGTVLHNRFEIVRQIGQGGMGAVYEGRDQKFAGSRVAIKQCLLTSEQMKRAFFREASLLASLEHPYLPDVREHFVEGDGHFLVMKFIEGEDLETLLIKRGRPFDVADVKPWMEQLLDALAYMHALETPVIHRDIKPGNIKLTPNGHIKLLDFGLAKGGGGTSITGYSLNYAAPEQMQETGSDARSDLYSLGATMYRLLSGQHPKSAFERSNALINDLPDPLVPLSQLNPRVSEEIGQVVAKAMALKQKDRIQHATEMKCGLIAAFETKDEVEILHSTKQVDGSGYSKTIALDNAKWSIAEYQKTIHKSKPLPLDVLSQPIDNEVQETDLSHGNKDVPLSVMDEVNFLNNKNIANKQEESSKKSDALLNVKAFSFWLYILLSLVAGVSVGSNYRVIDNSLTLGSIAQIILSAMFSGFMLGVAQWVVLWRKVEVGWLWILANMGVGLIDGVFNFMAVNSFLRAKSQFERFLLLFIGSALGGVLIWKLVRRYAKSVWSPVLIGPIAISLPVLQQSLSVLFSGLGEVTLGAGYLLSLRTGYVLNLGAGYVNLATIWVLDLGAGYGISYTLYPGLLIGVTQAMSLSRIYLSTSLRSPVSGTS